MCKTMPLRPFSQFRKIVCSSWHVLWRYSISLPEEARESIMSTAEIIKSVIGLLDHRRLSTCILAFDIMDSFLSEGMAHHLISSRIEPLLKIA
jgi:hypothetical protein